MFDLFMNFISVVLNPFISAIICIVICSICVKNSIDESKKGKVGNQAQTVISVGVFFTFIGIAIGLYHFNTEAVAIKTSISEFLAGMKTAFITSIIGMFFAFIIKAIQSNVEKNEDEDYKKSLSDIRDIKKLTEQSTAVMQNALESNAQGIKANAQAIVMMKQSMEASNNETIKQLTEIAEILKEGMNSLKASIEASGNQQLINQFELMGQSMAGFIRAAESSQGDMKKIAEGMAEQTIMLNNLGNTLTQSIEMLSSSQEKQITAMGNIMRENISELGEKIENSGKQQIQLLTNMDSSISAMKENSAQSAKDSAAMLEESRAYQKESLLNEAKQNEILTANTEKIVALKDSFAEFTKNVSEIFGDGLMKALNNTIENLNQNLTEQFGENFKQLNAAVKDLNEWQQGYSDIVNASIEELKHINTVFTLFTETIAPKISDHIESLTNNLKTFTDTSEKNVAVQNNLNESTAKLAEMTSAAQENIEAVQRVFEEFNAFSKIMIEETQRGLEDYKDAVLSNINESVDAIKKAQAANNEAILQAAKSNSESISETARTFQAVANKFDTDVTQCVDRMNETSEKSLNNLGKAFEIFKADFERNAANILSHLEIIFKEIGERTNEQQGKAIDDLAVALNAVNTQMVDNYKTLFRKVAEINQFINQRGGR